MQRQRAGQQQAGQQADQQQDPQRRGASAVGGAWALAHSCHGRSGHCCRGGHGGGLGELRRRLRRGSSRGSCLLGGLGLLGGL